MARVSVSKLKANLSHYLRVVRRGGEVEILDRGVPVARLTRIASKRGEDDRRARLLRAGVLRPGSGNAARWLEHEPLTLKTSLRAALDEERDDRL